MNIKNILLTDLFIVFGSLISLQMICPRNARPNRRN